MVGSKAAARARRPPSRGRRRSVSADIAQGPELLQDLRIEIGGADGGGAALAVRRDRRGFRAVSEDRGIQAGLRRAAGHLPRERKAGKPEKGRGHVQKAARQLSRRPDPPSPQKEEPPVAEGIALPAGIPLQREDVLGTERAGQSLDLRVEKIEMLQEKPRPADLRRGGVLPGGAGGDDVAPVEVDGHQGPASLLPAFPGPLQVVGVQESPRQDGTAADRPPRSAPGCASRNRGKEPRSRSNSSGGKTSLSGRPPASSRKKARSLTRTPGPSSAGQVAHQFTTNEGIPRSPRISQTILSRR